MSHPSQPALFRPEVALAQSAQWLGSVRLHRPLSFSVATAAALGIALLLVPATGRLAISASQAGTVIQIPGS